MQNEKNCSEKIIGGNVIMNHNKSPVEKQLVTVTELSGLTGLSKYTIRKFISEGGLPVVKSGRKCYISYTNFQKFIGGKINDDECE